MNPPTHQPPSDEAVKAAFDFADFPRNSVTAEQIHASMSPLCEGYETHAEAAARILAAHARARDNEVLRLTSALKDWPRRVRDVFSLDANAPDDAGRDVWWKGYEGCLQDCERHVEETLTGEAGA